MAIPTIVIQISRVVFEKYDVSGFAIIRFSVNHLNKVIDSFSRSWNTIFKFLLVEREVLSSR